MGKMIRYRRVTTTNGDLWARWLGGQCYMTINEEGDVEDSPTYVRTETIRTIREAQLNPDGKLEVVK